MEVKVGMLGYVWVTEDATIPVLIVVYLTVTVASPQGIHLQRVQYFVLGATI